MKHLILVLLFIVPFCAHGDDGESGWYGTLGVGTMTFKGINPSKIVNNPHFSSSTTEQNKTNFGSVALGYNFCEYFAVEGAYLTGAKFSISTQVQGVDVGTFDFAGTKISTGAMPAKFTVLREAELTAVQLSVIGKLPVTSWLTAFVRGGILEYDAETKESILLPQNLRLSEEGRKKGRIPMFTLGVIVKPMKDFNVTIEGVSANGSTLGLVSAVYKF